MFWSMCDYKIGEWELKWENWEGWETLMATQPQYE